LAVLAALVVAAIAVGAPRSSNSDPLDPASTASDGTKALVLLLRSSGAVVQVTSRMPDSSTRIALLLEDTTSQAQTDQLTRWVRNGGVLVVADPASSFVPIGGRGGGLLGLPSEINRGDCTIDALADLDHVFVPDAGLYTVPSGSARCFGTGLAAFVVDTPSGAGHLVALGSPSPLTNGYLDNADNAALAVGLLAPQPRARVSVLWGMTGSGAAGSTGGLGDLISVGVQLAFVELLIAFAVYAWWRGRRLGKPVLETQPVAIAGSELVEAHGNLLQQSHDPDRAARVLRSDLRRRLCERLGLPPDAPPGIVAEVTAARTGIDRDRVARAVTELPVRSDAELLELARDIDTIRTEVLHGTAP
jgi:hypothetical protein